MKEIDDIKNKHHRDRRIKIEEEDIIPYVENDLNDEEINTLLANELLKIDELGSVARSIIVKR